MSETGNKGIAAVLRDIAQARRRGAGCGAEVEPFGISCNGMANCNLCVASVYDAVADRAEAELAAARRGTCENVCDGREFECSACGMEWHLLDRAGIGEEWAHVRTPGYCPGCGAEVTR